MAYDTNTKLLLHMDGADASTTFTDSESTPKTFTQHGSAHIDTAQSEFGGASLRVAQATSDYISTPHTSDFNFTGDFFISCWYKSNSRRSYSGIVSNLTSGSGVAYNGWTIGTDNISGSNDPFRFIVWINSTNSTLNITGTVDINNGAWHYLEVSRSGSTIRIFVDGTEGGSATYASTINGDSGTLTIGDLWNDGNIQNVDAWIDEVIIVNGTAGHTSNYIAPTAAWDNPAATGGGSMLLMFA